MNDDDRPAAGAAGTKARSRTVPARAGRQGRRCPAELRFLFADPPLAPGESKADWTALCDSLAAALRPATVVDWLRLRDVACGVWESLRMQRYRDSLLRLERGRAATELLSGLLADTLDDPATRQRAARSIVRGWLSGRGPETREVAQALASAGADEQTIAAGAFLVQLETHERLERLRRRAEDARDAALARLGGAVPLPQDDGGDIVIDAEIVADEGSASPRPAKAARRNATRRGGEPEGIETDAPEASPEAVRQPDLFG